MKKKEYLLSLTELKRILNLQSREQLMELLIDSYKTIPQIKEYITMKYANQDIVEQILEVYKSKVYDVFFPEDMRVQFKISEARKAVNDFKKLCSNKSLVVDLMLYYVEMGVTFTNTYGDISESFYNSIESMYQSVVDAINKQDDPQILQSLEYRLKAVVENTSEIGWGFHDELERIYSEIIWDKL